MSLKSWLAEKFIDGKLPNWMYRFVGREISIKLGMEDNNMADDTKPWFKSKTIWSAIVGVLLGAVQPISTAFGHPVVIPNWVFEVLGGLGLVGLRTGDTPIA